MREKVKFEDLEDQSAEVIKWEGYQSILLISLLIGCAAINMTGKGLFIHFIWKYAPKGRPINLMFMKDQAVQIFAVTICSGLVIISLTSGESLEAIFGSESCWILWAGSSILNMSHSMGGLEMAIYRLICIKFQYLALDQNRSRKICKRLILITGVINLTLLATAFVGTKMAGTTMTLEFCKGQTRTFAKVLAQSQGTTPEDIDTGLGIIALLFIFGQIVIIAEFTIYGYLFFILHKENKRNTAIPADMKRRKFKRNAMTLSGQAMSFVIESIGGVFAQILLISQFGGVETTFYPCLQIILVTAITISHFVASPELKRHYFNFDF